MPSSHHSMVQSTTPSGGGVNSSYMQPHYPSSLNHSFTSIVSHPMQPRPMPALQPQQQ